jgi:hypothetical protein
MLLEFWTALTGGSATSRVKGNPTTGAIYVEQLTAGGWSSATPVSPSNISGTIATGGQFQTLSALKVVPRKLRVRNMSTGTLYISAVGDASASSFPVLGKGSAEAGEYYETPYSTINAISIFGATTGQAFFAEEW